MRILGMAVLFGFSCFSTTIYSAPFGLKQGMTLEQLGGNAKSLGEGKYRLESVPKPHSAFEVYIVQIGKESGLCFIKGVGKDVETSVYGTSLRSAYIDMKNRLTTVYGNPDRDLDRLLNGSIWHEENEWMMSLLKEERFLASVWKMSGRTGAEDVEQIILAARANSTSKGYIVLEYYLSNHSDCKKEIANYENDAL